MMKKVCALLVVFYLGASLLFAQEEVFLKVYYSRNDFRLTQDAQNAIRKTLYGVKGGEFEINIAGYTDEIATQEYNMTLSELRARQAAEFVKSLLIDIENLRFEGFGEVKPYDGPDEVENPEDRRVEIYAKYSPLRGKSLKDFEQKIATQKNNRKFKESEELSEDYRELLSRSENRVASIDVGDTEDYVADEIESYSEDVVEDWAEVEDAYTDSVDEVYEEDVREAVKKNYDEVDVNDTREGDKIVFPDIQFKPARDKILKTSKDNLDVLYELMTDNPSLRVEIQGHVCCGESGTPQEKEYIDTLSKLRAKAVYDYLLDKGISSSRMTYEGYGFSDPLVYPELSKEDEKKNRRVEIEIKGK